jgi:hypothetical protein
MRLLAAALVLGLMAHAAQAAPAAQRLKPDRKGALTARVVIADNPKHIQRLAGKKDRTPMVKNVKSFRARKPLHIATLVSGWRPTRAKTTTSW